MKSLYGIIREPHLSEKVVNQKEEGNKVTFKVQPSANKIEIKNAVESIFNVTVEKVSTINLKGKPKRVGYIKGKRSDWKKAIITLKEGDSIEYFEGA